jgi:hypothetical protein
LELGLDLLPHGAAAVGHSLLSGHAVSDLRIELDEKVCR